MTFSFDGGNCRKRRRRRFGLHHEVNDDDAIFRIRGRLLFPSVKVPSVLRFKPSRGEPKKKDGRGVVALVRTLDRPRRGTEPPDVLRFSHSGASLLFLVPNER
jgi:hypothetical protein